MNNVQLRPRAVRTVILVAGMVAVLGVFVLRLVHLQLFQHESWAERARRNHMTQRVLEMKRGTIYDRNKVEFALSVETYTVFLFMREIKSVRDTAQLLSTVIPMTQEEILAKVADKKGYISIYENLERPLANKVRALNLPGVNLEEHFQRFYPQNALCSNLLGFTGKEGNGLEGLEMKYDHILRGYSGLAVQEDVSISESSTGRLRIVRPPMGGSDLVLTIDSFIQHILESELAKLVEEYHPIDTTAIAMDPHTGEILGMAVLPNYDLNRFGNSTPAHRRNRPVVDLFEPGSCMKIFAVASALQQGIVGPNTRFYCRGYGEVNGRRIKCHGQHGLVDVNEAIAQSCNAAMSQISQMLEQQQLFRTYRQAGFGECTGIAIPGEHPGIFRPPSKWSGFSATSLCIGQEMMVTGVQLVAAYGAIANGGRLLEPKVVKSIQTQNNDFEEHISPLSKRQIFSQDLAKKLRQMLMGVVEDGTATKARLNDYTVGGKTSTAQKANPKGGYFSEKVHVSFIGMAPVANPRIVLLVAANEPKGEERLISGGKVAGPTFARIIDRILKHLKVPPDKKTVFSVGRQDNLKGDTRIPIAGDTGGTPPAPVITPRVTLRTALIGSSTQQIMPDLRGRTLKEVVQMVRALDVKAVFSGNGIATAQKPEPGIPLQEAHLVAVTFSPKGTL